MEFTDESPVTRFEKCFALLLAAWLVGCGDTDSRIAPLPEGVDRDHTVESFVLLNEHGKESVARDERRGLSPFGVFLKVPRRGERGQCTLAHVTPGRIVTNAHCVRGYRNLNRDDFYAIFFHNQTGEKVKVSIEDFIYVGNEGSDDVAVMSIAGAATAQWDVVSTDLFGSMHKHRDETIGGEVPTVEEVIIWAFDPLTSRSDFSSSFPDKYGGVFSPKRCKASRTLPQVGIKRWDWLKRDYVRVGRKLRASSKSISEATHVFIDDCSSSTMAGNSGSLITDPSFSHPIGVFHWTISKSEFRQKEDYFGNRSVWLSVWGGDIPGGSDTTVLNFGTVFDSVLQQHPELHTRF